MIIKILSLLLPISFYSFILWGIILKKNPNSKLTYYYICQNISLKNVFSYITTNTVIMPKKKLAITLGIVQNTSKAGFLELGSISIKKMKKKID